MIRKFNIALGVVLVALFALKGLNEIRVARSRAAAATDTPEIVREAHDLPPPNVYYEQWPYFTCEDPLSNRNGILLDSVRAIFPGAKFILLRDVRDQFREKLRTDPRAVVVGYGRHPIFEDCQAAPTPLGYGKFVLMTLRSNPWRYTGPESLDKVRIVMSEDDLDCGVLRERHKKLGPDSPLVRVMPHAVEFMGLANMVETGKADAFVTSGDHGNDQDTAIETMSVTILQRFRKSSAIGSADMLLYVTSADKDYAKRIIEAYEAGIRRIDASGERRRIFEYYGMVPPPIK